MRSKVACFFVVFCAVAAMIIAGCAKSNNPVSVATELQSDNFAIVAGIIVPGGVDDTIGTDTGLVNDNWIFTPRDINGKKDSVKSSTYDFGDGTVTGALPGLAIGVHRYASAGRYYVHLYVLKKDGVIENCGIYVVVVNSRVTPSVPSKDSVFKFISSTMVGTNTNVYSATFGTLVTVVTPASGTVNPFEEGYDDWGVQTLLLNQPKSSNGRLYLVTKTLEGGTFYDVGIGKRWNGTDNSSVWLSPTDQAGNKYYNPAKKIMSFYFAYNGLPYPLDSIPADSGRGIVVIPPVTADTTHPGQYGDAGANWRVRFADIVHSTTAGGLDSTIIYCSLHGLEACSTSTATMTSNIVGKSSINLTRPAGKLYAYTIVAAAEIPNADGLIWNYSWGSCIQSSNAASNFWSYAVNGVTVSFQARWVPYDVSLAKKAAGASGHLVPR